MVLTLPGISTCAIKCKGDRIRDDLTSSRIEAKSERHALHLVRRFLCLIEFHRLVHLSDPALLTKYIYINRLHIGFLPYIDVEYRNSNLLRHTSTVNKARAGALLANAGDALADLNVHTCFHTNVFTLPSLCSVAIPETSTYHKPAILNEACTALCLEISEIRFVEYLVLIDIAVVGCDKDVRPIGITDGFDDADYLVHFIFCSLEYLCFCCQSVTHFVDSVTVDINQVVVLHPVLVAYCQKLFCLDRSTLWYCCL